MDGLRKLLEKATEEELKGLAEILKAEPTPDSIIDSLWWNSQSIFGYAFGNRPSYKDIVRQVANKLKVKYEEHYSTKEIEIEIARKVMETVWERITPEQREEMEKKMRENAQEFDETGEAADFDNIFEALIAGRLFGFGIWIGAGLFAIWKLTDTNYKRLIPAVLYISALRSKQYNILPSKQLK